VLPSDRRASAAATASKLPALGDPRLQDAAKRSLEEYLSRRPEPLARLRVRVDDREYPSLFAALRDPEAKFTRVDLVLVDPPAAGPRWEYLRPFQRLVIEKDSSVALTYLDGSASPRGMARLLLREFLAPEIDAGLGPSGTAPSRAVRGIAESVNFARKTNLLPFAVALLIYFGEERMRVELDLLDGLVLPDPRAGRLPLSRHVRRSSRLSFFVDQYVAREELSPTTARALEILAETRGLTVIDLGQIFGGIREIAGTALETLRSRGLASFDARTGLYRARLDQIVGIGERLRSTEEPLRPAARLENPALRTSVQELIAAADQRATCPLCGDLLPPGWRPLLCERCQAEVGPID
jgi:hypothetical protein